MTNMSKAHILVVDDDSCIRSSIKTILEHTGYRCTCFSSAEECLANLNSHDISLIVTDVQMSGKTGVELVTEVKRIAPWLEILVMTSYANIPMSVRAIKAGAYDFIEKPVNVDNFLKTIKTIVEQDKLKDFLNGKDLTKTEKIILRLILKGFCNKQIAGTLHRSIRTVEDHRNHIMRKLDAENVVDLVKKATAMGLQEQS
ncbi:MAG: response regulator transcription factor [Planctomycetes bacterium]|nr:response regulator transcription factor [Planctomycetota bacterium]